jgi:hypothetical protein
MKGYVLKSWSRYHVKFNKEIHENAFDSSSLFDHLFLGLLPLKLNSLALVRERAIPTERPPLVGEVSANFCG